jgi:hypothetical protein
MFRTVVGIPAAFATILHQRLDVSRRRASIGAAPDVPIGKPKRGKYRR